MTFIKTFIAILLILIISTGAWAWTKYTQPLLVLDMHNAPELPKHFRLMCLIVVIDLLQFD